MKRVWHSVSLAMIGLLTVAACGNAASGAGGLPTLAPTITAVPPVTPTDVPEPDPIRLPPVDWDDVDKFRAAMRPAFAGDIDAFASRNRYYIEATLTVENGVAVIMGAERARYTNRSTDALTEIVFRLYPNMTGLGGRMKVYRAELNGIPVEPTLSERDTALIIPLNTPLQTGDSAEVMLEFSAAAERGLYAGGGVFGYQQEVVSAPEWYPALSVYEEGRGWWMARPIPMGDASYTESALFEVYLTTPQNFVVAMSGSELDAFPAGDGMTTHHYVSGPMRDSAMVAGPLFGKLTQYVDDIAVNVLVWPGDEPAAEEVMGIATTAVRTFNDAFGPYPFAELDVAETFMATGMEYPGIVLISNTIWERGDPFMEIATAHEVGHQWFYSLVGGDQVGHPWLDESLTSFTEYVHMRAARGEKRYGAELQSDRDLYNAYKGRGLPDLPLNLPVTSYTENNYALIIYVKGPLFFVELENSLGRDTFLAALRLYVARHRYELADSKDLLAAFEDASGQNLDAIFYQWVGEFEGLDPAVMDDINARQ